MTRREAVTQPGEVEFCDPEHCERIADAARAESVRAVQEVMALLREVSRDNPTATLCILYAAGGWSYRAIGRRFGLAASSVREMVVRRIVDCAELAELVARQNVVQAALGRKGKL